MFFRLFFWRFKKLFFCLRSSSRWHLLLYGVAPSLEHRSILRLLSYDKLLDVGGNRGQFSLLSKYLFSPVPICAYEPLLPEAAMFRKVLSGFTDVALYQVALGSRSKTVDFHISKNADSSSVLPIGRLQKQLFPSTVEASRCRVPVEPLDSFPDHWKSASRAFLKIDVQGYELEVLRGALKALRHCAYVFVECSEVSLYEGQALRPEVQSFLEKQGFLLRSRHNETYDKKGNLIQADYLFDRAN